MNIQHLFLDIYIDSALITTIVILLVRLGREKSRTTYRDVRIKHLLDDRKDLGRAIHLVCQFSPEAALFFRESKITGTSHYEIGQQVIFGPSKTIKISDYGWNTTIESWRYWELGNEEIWTKERSRRGQRIVGGFLFLGSPIVRIVRRWIQGFCRSKKPPLD